jgi:bacterioferritin-associated ferredoxin
MALQPDDTVCFCFHVTRRKIENYCRIEKPQAASQISECLSAGTGCGWCIPMLRRIHTEICGEHKPWWRDEAKEISPDIDAEAWRAGRRRYIAEGKGTPAPGAEE